jgi:hypothetical protein
VSLTIKTYTRAISIGGLVVLLVAGVVIVVVAIIGLPITAASTSIITSSIASIASIASTTKGPPLKVKVIGIYKTLSS